MLAGECLACAWICRNGWGNNGKQGITECFLYKIPVSVEYKKPHTRYNDLYSCSIVQWIKRWEQKNAICNKTYFEISWISMNPLRLAVTNCRECKGTSIHCLKKRKLAQIVWLHHSFDKITTSIQEIYLSKLTKKGIC